MSIQTAAINTASLEENVCAEQPQKQSEQEYSVFLLSYAQQRLWFLDQLDSGNPRYTIPTAIELLGLLDVAVLKRSIDEIIRRHESLRTTFAAVSGRPIQIIAPTHTLKLPIINLHNITGSLQEAEVLQFAAAAAKQPFDLMTGPLLRTKLLSLSDTKHVLLLTMHHIISDGWSLDVFAQELGTLYTAFSKGEPSPLPDLPIQYADFAVWYREWMQGEILETQLDYWNQQMGGTSDRPKVPVLELPTDYPRPATQTFQGAKHLLTLPEPLTNAVKVLSQQSGSTLFMIVLAAWQVLLGRSARQTDFAVGTVVANRLRPDLEPLIGCFANTLVLRADLAGNPTFAELLARVRSVCLDAFAHQDLPFEQLVEALQPERDLSRQPLVQVMLSQTPPLPSLDLPGLTFTPHAIATGTAKFDLQLTLVDQGPTLQLLFDYSTELFAPVTITRMADHLHVLLANAVVDPRQPISTLSLLTDAEQRCLLADWGCGADVSFPQQLLHDLVAAQVARTPASVALCCGDQHLTYHALEQRANQLAHALQQLHVGPEARVALCLDRSLELVIAVLAVLKAGAAYLPLDPSYPAQRLAFLLDDSQASVLITAEDESPKTKDQGDHDSLVLRPSSFVHTVDLARDWPSIAQQPTDPPACAALPDNLAYVIYTSGSTGAPKGVLVPHRGVVNYLLWCVQSYPWQSGGGALLHSSLAFDLSVTSLFGPLLSGQTVELLPQGQELEGVSAALRTRAGYSVVKLTPTHLELLRQQLGAHELAGRTAALVIGGEALRGEQLQVWQTQARATRLVNEYGPSETVVGCCVYELPPQAVLVGSVPIGRPIANTQLYVLDEQLALVPIGMAGELYIGGAGVVRGYQGRPALTAERFVPNPFASGGDKETRRQGDKEREQSSIQNPKSKIQNGERLYKSGDLVRWRADGQLEYLGRIDDQVKLRGYRVELGEIEAALLNHPHIDQAAVVMHEDETGYKRLAAYVVPRDAATLTPSTIIDFLGSQLPEYMVPRLIMVLHELPQTPSGKVDRKALPAFDTQRPDTEVDFVAPQTLLEQEIAQAFTEVLGVNRIGMNDNFFDLGGDSLLMTRLAARLSNSYDVHLPMLQLFQVPTAAGVTHVVEAYQREGNDGTASTWDASFLEEEIRLDPAITPEWSPGLPDTNPTKILLTGATGYIGAFLIECLLRKTGAEVFCLTRTPDLEQGMERLKQSLQTYRIWDDAWQSRIHLIAGDLAQPLCGLTQSQFAELAATIDTIYHSGAMVNFAYPYATVKGTNVGGTQEILRLACQGRMKTVHYISTIDTFIGTHMPRPYLEVDPPRQPVVTPDGYMLSKWVAEHLMVAARDRGVPVCIYRLPWVLGHTKTGVAPINNMLLVELKGFLQLGVFPDEGDSVVYDGVTVDYAAEAIIYLSMQPESLGKNFHIWNLQLVSFSQIYEWIRNFGYTFDVAPHDVTRELVKQVEPSHPLYPLIPILLEEHSGTSEPDARLQGKFDPRIECTNALEGLEGSGLECPLSDDKLTHLCLSYLVDVGFLDPVSRAVGDAAAIPAARA